MAADPDGPPVAGDGRVFVAHDERVPAGQALDTDGQAAGVNLLLDAIPHVADPALEFWFSGRCTLEGRLRQQAASDSRIRFFGFVTEEDYSTVL